MLLKYVYAYVNDKIALLIAFCRDLCMFAFMITAAQVRAARALLAWRQADLASKSGIAEISVKNFERGATDARGSTIRKMETALVQAGVVFMPGGAKLDEVG